MDFKSVEYFIELVKNPAEFEKALAQLKDAQENLDKSIATVGKVNEIDKIKEKADKALKSAEKKQEDAEAQAKATIQAAQDLHEKLMKEVSDRSITVDSIKQAADAALVKAESLERELSARERKLRQDLEAYTKASAELAVKSQEVDERLAKLRQAMG